MSGTLEAPRVLVRGHFPSFFPQQPITPQLLELRSLGKYTCGTHQPGFITSHLQGRTVESLLIDGTWLIIRFTDGHEAKIGWQDTSGNQLSGEPFLENMDVKIAVIGASLTGKA